MNQDIICEIFNLKYDGEHGDAEIINKIYNSNNAIDYINNCMQKSIKYDKSYQDVVDKYILMIINGDIEENHSNIFESWIQYNVFNKWNIVLNSDDAIQKYLIIVNNSNNAKIKYENIKNMLMLSCVQNLIGKNYLKNGIREEKEGPLLWFSHNAIIKNLNVFDCIIDYLCENEILLNIILDRIGHILMLNKSYTYSNLNMINIEKASSVEYVHMIFRFLLKILQKYSCNELKYVKSFPRYNYEVSDFDNITTKLLIYTCRCYHICYNSQITIYFDFMMKLKNLEKKISQSEPSEDTMNTLYNMITKKENVYDIITNSEYQNDVKKFIDIYIEKNIYMNDDFVDSLISASVKKITYYNDYTIEYNLKKYYMNLLSGHTKNPHIKYNVMCYILNIFEVKGYSGDHIDIFNTFTKYVCEVNYFDDRSLKQYNKHFINLMSNISKLVLLINKNNLKKNIDIEYVFKGIHKISSIIIFFLEKLNDYIILNQYSFNTTIDQSIKYFMDNIYLAILSQHNIMKYVVENTEKIQSELALIICTFITQTFTIIAKGDIVFSLYNRKIEIQNILKELFGLMIMLKCNVSFTKNINNHVNLIKDMLNVCLDENLKNEINEYIYADLSNQNIKLTNVPEEFLDPILCVVIDDPIMIPKVDLIFDRSSIMSQLYYENINPYTREKLTIEDVDSYNKESHIIEKIKKYTEKYNDWCNKNE